MDLCAAVVADEESAALVQPGEGAFYDPALAAETRAVLGLPTRDDGLDATRPELTPSAPVVVATVGDQSSGASTGPADATADRWDGVEEREQLGDVMAVAAREAPGQGQATAVGQEVMLGARTASVDRARARFGAPFFAWI